MYFPEDNCPFYRVTVFSNYSPNNTPAPGATWSLMAEVSESPHKPVDGATVVAEVIRGLQDTHLLSPDADILTRWHRRLEHGYPTPSRERDAILAVSPRPRGARDLLPRPLRSLAVRGQQPGPLPDARGGGGRATDERPPELTLNQPDLVNGRFIQPPIRNGLRRILPVKPSRRGASPAMLTKSPMNQQTAT